jgi:hypothetical protein
MSVVTRYTSAPEAYDGFGTRTIALTDWELPKSHHRVRQVEIEAEHLEWQTSRNSSGLHVTLTEAQFREWQEYGFVAPVEPAAEEA